MKKIIQLLTLAIILFVGAISCKKNSFDINLNPNQATDSTIVYNLILPAAQNNTARVVARNWGWLQNYLGYWARSGTYAPNTQEETYQITTSFQSQIWDNTYDNLNDYNSMQISADKVGADFYSGIARIMKAHGYAILVDIYNDIPYVESLKGAANTTPKYDQGIDIYKDLLRQIDTGMALIKNADLSTSGPNKSIANDDIMFGTKLFTGTTGDEMKVRWAQFANTLKLRLLTKFMNGGVASNAAGTVGTPASTVPGVDLTAEFGIIAAEGSGFISEDVQVQPGYATDKGNPFYNLYVTDNTGVGSTQGAVYYKANSYAVGYYQYNGDPRIGRFYGPGPGGYRGVAYGLPSATENAAATLSAIGPGVTGTASSPQRIFTAAEGYFLQAECIHRGFLSGDAQTALNTGIEASFTSLGLSVSQADDYIAFNATYADVDYTAPERFGGAPGGLFTIISQKWFALNAIAPYEVWSDYRRVDFSSSVDHFVYGTSTAFDATDYGYNLPEGPPISVSPGNAGATARNQIPNRLLYPQNEYLYNPTNVSAEPDLGAYPYARVFWDIN